jgi:hypothetical protein
MQWTRVAATLFAVAVVPGVLSGCDALRERVCADGEYPVWSVRSPESGGACVAEGKEPMRGYAEYPAGLVPEYFDEIVTCPDGKCKGGPLAIECPNAFPAKPCTIAGRHLPLP